MRVVLNTTDPLLAQAARDHLIAHGILAAAVQRVEGWAASVRSHDVILCFGKQYDDARELLATDHWRPKLVESDAWETEDAPPDLSRLDSALAPACPGCGRVLPLDATVEACASCGGAVDVAELIAQEHGPEALGPCYDDGETPLDPVAIERLALLCPRCQYPLRGLSKAGVCPECGGGYDKHRIVGEFMGR